MRESGDGMVDDVFDAFGLDVSYDINIGTQGVQELFFFCEVLEIETFMVQ